MRPNSSYALSAAQAVSDGWVQHCWRDEDGNVCLLQAVSEALGNVGIARELPMRVQLRLDAVLMRSGSYCRTRKQRRQRARALKQGRSLQHFIWSWNDDPGRTKAEVVGVLRALARDIEEERHQYLQGLITRAIRPRGAVLRARQPLSRV